MKSKSKEDMKEHKGGRSEQIANIAKIRVIAKNPKDGQLRIGTALHRGEGRFAGLGRPGKLLIPRSLRAVPGISQVFENGIVSAYVSQLAPSK
jgi:hypothetical protein